MCRPMCRLGPCLSPMPQANTISLVVGRQRCRCTTRHGTTPRRHANSVFSYSAPELRYWFGSDHRAFLLTGHLSMVSYNFARKGWSYRIQDVGGRPSRSRRRHRGRLALPLSRTVAGRLRRRSEPDATRLSMTDSRTVLTGRSSTPVPVHGSALTTSPYLWSIIFDSDEGYGCDT